MWGWQVHDSHSGAIQCNAQLHTASTHVYVHIHVYCVYVYVHMYIHVHRYVCRSCNTDTISNELQVQIQYFGLLYYNLACAVYAYATSLGEALLPLPLLNHSHMSVHRGGATGSNGSWSCAPYIIHSTLFHHRTPNLACWNSLYMFLFSFDAILVAVPSEFPSATCCFSKTPWPLTL